MQALPSPTDVRVTRIRAVVASGGRLWAAALRSLVSGIGSISVLAQVRDYARLEASVAEHRPDVVLLDLPIEGLGTPPQLLDLRKLLPELGFALLVQRDGDLQGLRALVGHPGVALLTPDARRSDVAFALRMAAAGFTTVCPWLVGHVLAEPAPSLLLTQNPVPSLTPREVTVLERLARGQNEASIARTLGIGVRTVETQIARAREKLRARDRTHAVALALEGGLIRGPSNGA